MKAKKTLEIKIKSENVNKKKSFIVGNLILQNPLFSSIKKLNSDVNKILIEEEKRNHFIPVLYNNYNRKYFYNDQLDVRITIDSDLNFLSLFNKGIRSENEIIIEIKYSSKILKGKHTKINHLNTNDFEIEINDNVESLLYGREYGKSSK